MLRSFIRTTPVVATSSLFSITATVAATATTAQRKIAVFSEQSDALENAAKYKGYKSNVWFEEEDLYRLSRVSKLKAQQEPVEARILRRIELYNADQLVTKPEDCFPEPELHASLRTKSNYSAKFQRELDEIAQRYGFQSKWWFSDREVFKRKLRIKSKGVVRPSAIYINTNAKCFNADQFDNPRVALEPVSGFSRKLMAANTSDQLVPICQQKGYKTGLFFGAKQLEGFGLTLKPDEQPAEIEMIDREEMNKMRARGPRTLYNIAELEDHEAILKQLGRFPIDHPCYISGNAIRDEVTLKKLQESESAVKVAKGESSLLNYWLTPRDVDTKRYKIKADAKPITIDAFDAASGPKKTVKVSYFNAEQVTEPERAFKMAGSPTKKRQQ